MFAVAAPGVHTPPPPAECPYPGLLSFTDEDAERFFGREEVVDDIVARLHAHPFLAVVGASGAASPPCSEPACAAPRHRGRSSPRAPGRWPASGVDGPVVVDQFEELFTLGADDDERDAFLDRLLAWPHPVAIGLRADFYGACAEHPGSPTPWPPTRCCSAPWPPTSSGGPSPSRPTRAGLKIEPGLVDVLVAKVAGEPGALPLLSHALRSTWEVRDGRTLTLEGYRSTGGVEGAIAATADGAVDALDPADQALARQLFVRLVEPGRGTADTRGARS